MIKKYRERSDSVNESRIKKVVKRLFECLQSEKSTDNITADTGSSAINHQDNSNFEGTKSKPVTSNRKSTSCNTSKGDRQANDRNRFDNSYAARSRDNSSDRHSTDKYNRHGNKNSNSYAAGNRHEQQDHGHRSNQYNRNISSHRDNFKDRNYKSTYNRDRYKNSNSYATVSKHEQQDQGHGSNQYKRRRKH